MRVLNKKHKNLIEMVVFSFVCLSNIIPPHQNMLFFSDFLVEKIIEIDTMKYPSKGGGL